MSPITTEERIDVKTVMLTERMRSATKQFHDKSDRLVNLKLAFVLTSRQLYGESLGLFAPIYERLELALEKYRNGKLGPISALLDDMRRVPSFEADLRFYLGEKGLQELRQRQREGHPPELKEYLDHLDAIEREDPALLAVYVYHMYMAIMAGGYIIRKMVKRIMGLKGDEGVRALSFRSDVDSKTLRIRLKNCINEEVGFSDEQEKRVVEESAKVFELNNKLVATVKDTSAFHEVVARWMWWLQVAFVLGFAVALAYFWRSK